MILFSSVPPFFLCFFFLFSPTDPANGFGISRKNTRSLKIAWPCILFLPFFSFSPSSVFFFFFPPFPVPSPFLIWQAILHISEAESRKSPPLSSSLSPSFPLSPSSFMPDQRVRKRAYRQSSESSLPLSFFPLPFPPFSSKSFFLPLVFINGANKDSRGRDGRDRRFSFFFLSLPCLFFFFLSRSFRPKNAAKVRDIPLFLLFFLFSFLSFFSFVFFPSPFPLSCAGLTRITRVKTKCRRPLEE